jgi:hypothetical protein
VRTCSCSALASSPGEPHHANTVLTTSITREAILTHFPLLIVSWRLVVSCERCNQCVYRSESLIRELDSREGAHVRGVRFSIYSNDQAEIWAPCHFGPCSQDWCESRADHFQRPQHLPAVLGHVPARPGRKNATNIAPARSRLSTVPGRRGGCAERRAARCTTGRSKGGTTVRYSSYSSAGRCINTLPDIITPQENCHQSSVVAPGWQAQHRQGQVQLVCRAWTPIRSLERQQLATRTNAMPHTVLVTCDSWRQCRCIKHLAGIDVSQHCSSARQDTGGAEGHTELLGDASRSQHAGMQAQTTHSSFPRPGVLPRTVNSGEQHTSMHALLACFRP